MKTLSRLFPALAALLIFAAPSGRAQQRTEGADAATVQKLQNLNASRPGYRQRVTPQAAAFYQYILAKRQRGEPITSMENLTIRMMIATRAWPVPPKPTEADRVLAHWIDTHDTITANSVVIGTHAASGRIDYDAASANVERFRAYYHNLPPERRTFAANLMMNYYCANGFDMRTDKQRADDAARQAPQAPSAKEVADAARAKDNADRAAQAAKDNAVFDAIKARDRLEAAIKTSKDGGPDATAPETVAEGTDTEGTPPAVTDPAAQAQTEAGTAKPSSRKRHKTGGTGEEETEAVPPENTGGEGEGDGKDTQEPPGDTTSSGKAAEEDPGSGGNVAGAEGAFDGVYRGQIEGDRMTVSISGAIASVVIGKVTMSGSVDKNGTIRATWSGVSESMEVEGGGAKGEIKIRSTLSLSGRAKGDSVSGTLAIHSSGPGGYDEDLPTVNWSCTR